MTRTIGVISAMLLAGLSAYCFITYLKTTGYTPTFALVTFAVGALYGILTGLNEVSYDVGGDLRRNLEKWADFLEDNAVVPCLATEMWLQNGIIPREAAWIHALAAAVITVLYLLDKSIKSEFQDTLQIVSVVSLIVAGVLNNCFSTIGAGVAYGIGRFSFRKGENCMEFNCIDLYNLSLCAFSGFALLALTGKLF